ncbi:S41 family peptidase [Pedobacter sp. PF22-3]|uniref:S41 family peptidase n=1 Tax=Pedobacter sp. PF22-3 TaxID=2994467 RepID=UPI00224666EF|nr:S41 family peptidase [Pedobacter sp. PF22-3]MCX2493371.1 S41 family peptidase [Pedobacter sp. PF22-3]
MKKDSIAILVFLFFSLSANAQVGKNQIPLKVDKVTADLTLKQGEETSFSFLLKKDFYYSITVEQKGIDVTIRLKDYNGKTIQDVDSPNGRFGSEKIVFSPDSTANFTLTVKPLAETTNAKEGNYSVLVQSPPKKLTQLSYKALEQDFNTLKNAFIETHVGLWYNTYTQFDSLCNVQKSKIRDKMTALDFYQLVTPVVTYTKEGHSAIQPAEETNNYIRQNGRYFPFLVKILDKRVYILNDLDNYKTKGMMISKINGNSIETIMQQFLTIEPADGYNTTSKYRWIETAFSKYYLRFFEQQPNFFDIELINPKTSEKINYKGIPALSFKQYEKFVSKEIKSIPNYNYKEPAALKIDTLNSTATLTVNTFSTNSYTGGRKGFKEFLAKSFQNIADRKIKHLIIDIRKNEGGAQAMEDHLMSYLVDKEYPKYKYAEIPSFTYSFLDYTAYREKESRDDFEKDLKAEFYRSNDGRYLDLPGKYKSDTPQTNHFKGDLYILISGLSFSGGSEFAALAKNYTSARFIGEETGGGYYGNTSGFFINYTLPNSKLTGRIPLIKFVVEEKQNGIPFGHGVMPDHEIQPTIEEYFRGYDAEMEFVKKQIKNK